MSRKSEKALCSLIASAGDSALVCGTGVPLSEMLSVTVAATKSKLARAVRGPGSAPA